MNRSLSNNILTPFIPNPNFMPFSCRNIDPRAHSKGLLLDFSINIVIWISDRHRATANEMCC